MLDFKLPKFYLKLENNLRIWIEFKVSNTSSFLKSAKIVICDKFLQFQENLMINDLPSLEKLATILQINFDN
jgi:hypothetical protein